MNTKNEKKYDEDKINERKAKTSIDLRKTMDNIKEAILEIEKNNNSKNIDSETKDKDDYEK